MSGKEAARRRGNCERATSVHFAEDATSIARTVGCSALFLAAVWAVPTLMALAKCWGWW